MAKYGLRLDDQGRRRSGVSRGRHTLGVNYTSPLSGLAHGEFDDYAAVVPCVTASREGYDLELT